MPRRKNLHNRYTSTPMRRRLTIPKITNPMTRPVLSCAFGGAGVGVGTGVGVIAGVGVGGGIIVGIGVGEGVGLGVTVGEKVVEAVRFRGILRPVSHVPVSKA